MKGMLFTGGESPSWAEDSGLDHGEHEAGGVAGGSGDRGVGEPGGCWKALILEVIGPTK